ncbi:hypothetical protein [Corynebacterium pyruviciproducens]|nr:hypothetical protein [Corynebacterium pyruviciproducens]
MIVVLLAVSAGLSLFVGSRPLPASTVMATIMAGPDAGLEWTTSSIT